MDSHTKTTSQNNNRISNLDWEKVYKETLPKVFHFFCYRVGDNFVAEDLTSITYEKAWSSRNRFRDDIGSFTQWIFGIARNVVTDYFRNSYKEELVDDITQGSDKNSPEINFQRASDYSRLTTLFSRLPDRERDLLSLKYGAELTNRAIAELTDLSETNVGTILYRVVRKLRSEWEDDR